MKYCKNFIWNLIVVINPILKETIMEKNNVIGIDPGLAHCGWGIICPASYQARGIHSRAFQTLRFIECGEIKTNNSLPLTERLKKLYQELAVVFSHYQPVQCAVEELYFNKNSSSALPVAHARGVILLCATQHNAPVSEFSANLIKQVVTGHGKAQKKQVQEMVAFLLGLKQNESLGLGIQNSHHAADALAAAICLLHQQNSFAF